MAAMTDSVPHSISDKQSRAGIPVRGGLPSSDSLVTDPFRAGACHQASTTPKGRRQSAAALSPWLPPGGSGTQASGQGSLVSFQEVLFSSIPQVARRGPALVDRQTTAPIS